MTDTIHRDLVIGVLRGELSNAATALDLVEKTAEKSPEGLPRRRSVSEERIYTLFKVADELEVYDEVASGVVVPKYIKERYWGADHPKARPQARHRR